ncbi:MAG: hypothetical protein FJY09_01790 [Chlorobi bacterium]|nr:hypothetical protein [Chlorobiota bacterium]
MAESEAAAYIIKQEIAVACDGKKGTIDPSAVIERYLTGDGKADLIICNEGIMCANGERRVYTVTGRITINAHHYASIP